MTTNPIQQKSTKEIDFSSQNLSVNTTEIDLSNNSIESLNEIIDKIKKKSNEIHFSPSNIKNISLSNTPVTDEMIEFFVKTCPNLKNINLSKCSNITDQGVEAIAKNCSDLESINLRGCLITDTPIVAIANKHLKCKIIKITISVKTLFELILPRTSLK